LIDPSALRAAKADSTFGAFAAHKADGSIKIWGNPHFGGVDTPSNGVYTKIYSTGGAFAALKADGSIEAWGLYGRQRHQKLSKSWYSHYQRAHLRLQNSDHPTP
jgi:hypothetical protein